MIRIGSLFSGIGGLELGIERATGGSVAWQVESDAWCRDVLAKHWPHAQRFDDVCTVGARELAPVEVICGGFPCQDISTAGRGAGLAGERSGLWREFARIVREVRPRIVVVENVAALLARGLGDVLGDLAALGYDAEWDCVPAAAVGAPHRRDRLFVVAYAAALAYAHGEGESQHGRRVGDEWRRTVDGREALAHAHRFESERPGVAGVVPGASRSGEGEGAERQRDGDAARDRREALADTDGERFEERDGEPVATREELRSSAGRGRIVRDRAAEPGVGGAAHGFSAALDRVREAAHRWPARPGEPQHPWEAPRTARGVPGRDRRLKALGNAVLPQVAEAIGHVVRERLESMELVAANLSEPARRRRVA